MIPLNRIDISLSKRQMASGILVNQRIIEQNTAAVNGAVPRHQCTFTQISTAFIHANQLIQQLRICLSAPLHSLALMEADPEILRRLSMEAQGLCSIDDALCRALLRCDKALLRRQIRREGRPVLCCLPDTLKTRFRHHTDAEICAIAAAEVKLLQWQTVDVVATALQLRIMRRPCSNRIAVHAANGKNQLPQSLHCLTDPQLRKQPLSPRRTRHTGKAPLTLVLHRIPVRLINRPNRLL